MPIQLKRRPQAKHAEPSKPAHAPSFDDLPDSGLIRQSQLVPNPKRPGVPTPLPFSACTLWRRVRAGQFPQPLRLSPGMTVWKVGDVRRWLVQAEANDTPTKSQRSAAA